MHRRFEFSGDAYAASAYQLDIYTVKVRLATEKCGREAFSIDSSTRPSGPLGITPREYRITNKEYRILRWRLPRCFAPRHDGDRGWIPAFRNDTGKGLKPVLRDYSVSLSVYSVRPVISIR